MALTINTNIGSIIAQSYATSSSNSIAKNIERLSSGLRINSAADDASGLAISEKLRAQISGLDKAAQNAQDGISMLQTAEGGLSTIQEITQRMRELAVQAANGTYTTSDREEIQKEVDQLKDEVDRIASSTEFNTKKLLNGDATALWSSDSTNIDVTVNSPVAEGNYNLAITVEGGSNSVYKTDIMTLGEDALGAEIYTAGGTANTTNVQTVSDVESIDATGTSYFTVSVAATDSTATGSASVTASYLQTGSTFSVSSLTNNGAATDSGYLEVKFTSDITSATSTMSNATVSYRFVSATTGVATSWSSDINATSNTAGEFAFTIADATIGSVGLTVNTANNGNIQEGDKVLISVSETQSGVTNGVSGGGTIKISGGPSAQSGPTIVYGTANSLTKPDNEDGTTDTNGVTVYYATLDETTGNLNIGNMTLNFKEDDSETTTNGKTTYGSFQLDVNGAGDIATTSTKLKDIGLFTTDDGANLFDQTQELTVYGNGTSATIYLEGDDTVADFETKLQDAIVNTLGMGADSGTSDTVSDVNNNLVNYISTETNDTNEAVGGTFVIQTAKLGAGSQLSFAGNESLINALSLATIQEGENSEMTVTVTDAHTGETVGKDTVNDFTLKNVIEGVDVEIDSAVGLSISWDDTNKEVTFTGSTEAENIKLHLVDNSTELQIGANEGQSLDVSIAQVDTDALGLSDVLMVDQESAQSAITQIDAALSRISTARATIGAQINRLEYTIAGLNTASENLTTSESRIRDLDMAAEMSDFTKNQVLSQVSVAMISQANAQSQIVLQILG